jgi:hypothetical protein
MQTENILNHDVSKYVEQKDGMSYLPWAPAWEIFISYYPTATYEVIKNQNGLPYFESACGAIVYTKVTVENLTHEMWLPVMNGANKPMKSEPYEYVTKYGPKTVDAYNMFDINKTIMRCLVKNMAMFGLGLYLYKGEDLPEGTINKFVTKIEESKNVEELKSNFKAAYEAAQSDAGFIAAITVAKDKRKTELAG